MQKRLFAETRPGTELFRSHSFWNLYLLWLIYIARDGLRFGFLSEIGRRDPSPSLCNANMFCIVQCSLRVSNPSPNPSPYPSLSLSM